MTPAATMAAAVYRRPGELDVVNVPVPALGPNDALVEVAYCGVCGTDLHMVLDGWGTPDTIFGHEWSGRVAAAGAEARIDTGHRGGGPGLGRVRPLPSTAGRDSPGLCVQRPLAGLRRRPFRRFRPLLSRRPSQPHRRSRRQLGLREAAYAEPLAVAMHAVTKSGSFQPGGTGDGCSAAARSAPRWPRC